jgi:hypothetical protein
MHGQLMRICNIQFINSVYRKCLVSFLLQRGTGELNEVQNGQARAICDKDQVLPRENHVLEAHTTSFATALRPMI